MDSFYPVKPFYARGMDTFNPSSVQSIVLLGTLLIIIAMKIKVFIQDVMKKRGIYTQRLACELLYNKANHENMKPKKHRET